jgi:hypothetical protein
VSLQSPAGFTSSAETNRDRPRRSSAAPRDGIRLALPIQLDLVDVATDHCDAVDPAGALLP